MSLLGERHTSQGKSVVVLFRASTPPVIFYFVCLPGSYTMRLVNLPSLKFYISYHVFPYFAEVFQFV